MEPDHRARPVVPGTPPGRPDVERRTAPRRHVVDGVAPDDEGTVNGSERLGVVGVDHEHGGPPDRGQLAEHRGDHGITVRADDGDGFTRDELDPDGHLVPGQPFDGGGRRVAPPIGRDGPTGSVEHPRRQHERRDTHLHGARRTAFQVGSAQCRSDPFEVAFEASEVVGRPCERGMDRARAAEVRTGTHRAGSDDLEPTPAGLDDRSRHDRHPSVGDNAIDAEWRPTRGLDDRRVTGRADVDQRVVGFEGRVGDAQVARRAPEPPAAGTGCLLPAGVGAGRAADRDR